MPNTEKTNHQGLDELTLISMVENTFRDYYPYFINIAQRLLQDHQAAQDAVQDALEKTWKVVLEKSEEQISTFELKKYISVAVYNNSLESAST